jgi:phosphoribosylformylglycinamidine synthase
MTIARNYSNSEYNSKKSQLFRASLQLEAVACKDWLTNKVDRCVGGKVAKQQCAGPLQLPLNNVGVMALTSKEKKELPHPLGTLLFRL